LVRGQVGTVIEMLDAEHTLVEFADECGATVTTIPVPTEQLLRLVGTPSTKQATDEDIVPSNQTALDLDASLDQMREQLSVVAAGAFRGYGPVFSDYLRYLLATQAQLLRLHAAVQVGNAATALALARETS
jgi:hypothetical protein